MPTNKEIAAKLREALQSADLEHATEKSIRKQLEKELGVDLSDKKPFIHEELNKYLEEMARDADAEEDDDDDDEEPPAKKGKAKPGRKSEKKEKKEKKKRAAPSGGGLSAHICRLSPELASILGEDELPRTQVVKKIWEYIKEHGLQDASDKRKINCDETLKALFKTDATDMFKMNKLLSVHIHKMDSSSKKAKVEEEEEQEAE